MQQILDAINGLNSQEMPRCKERGFCCGAGGARMWMEEHEGQRINHRRTQQALEKEPNLWRTYHDDNLIFKRVDFLDPDGSALFAAERKATSRGTPFNGGDEVKALAAKAP